jgi:hypothetical protein
MLAKLFASSASQVSGRRMFSRADILKSLDKSKINRKTFIKKELTENPEFFKAFPHMQVLFNAKPAEAGGTNTEDKIDDNPKYFHD